MKLDSTFQAKQIHRIISHGRRITCTFVVTFAASSANWPLVRHFSTLGRRTNFINKIVNRGWTTIIQDFSVSESRGVNTFRSIKMERELNLPNRCLLYSNFISLNVKWETILQSLHLSPPNLFFWKNLKDKNNSSAASHEPKVKIEAQIDVNDRIRVRTHPT